MFSETTFLMVFALGAACMLLGFFLVLRGVGTSDGESAVKLIGIEIRASKVGPGVLFALFGLVLVVTAVAKLRGASDAPKEAAAATLAPAAPAAQPIAQPIAVSPSGGEASDLLAALSRRNLHSSAGDAALRGWLDGDTHYRRLAQATLAALGDRRLTAGGADLLKVNYFYLREVGVQDEAQLPAGHVVEPTALQRALVQAHRDMNGGSAATLADIAQ